MVSSKPGKEWGKEPKRKEINFILTFNRLNIQFHNPKVVYSHCRYFVHLGKKYITPETNNIIISLLLLGTAGDKDTFQTIFLIVGNLLLNYGSNTHFEKGKIDCISLKTIYFRLFK